MTEKQKKTCQKSFGQFKRNSNCFVLSLFVFFSGNFSVATAVAVSIPMFISILFLEEAPSHFPSISMEPLLKASITNLCDQLHYLLSLSPHRKQQDAKYVYDNRCLWKLNEKCWNAVFFLCNFLSFFINFYSPTAGGCAPQGRKAPFVVLRDVMCGWAGKINLCEF